MAQKSTGQLKLPLLALPVAYDFRCVPGGTLKRSEVPKGSFSEPDPDTEKARAK
jgi:hypothetical protein